MILHRLLFLGALLFMLRSALACAGDANPYGGLDADAGTDAAAALDPAGDDASDLPESSSSLPPPFDGGTSPRPLADAQPPPLPEAGPEAASPPDAACVTPLGAGVLAIDELMIESVAGTGDYGEWLEVQNVTGCAVDLRGLHGECPAGSKLHAFDVSGDVWVAPGGTFVIADSTSAPLDHDLPGLVLTWDGQPGDVLRNLGGTVTLTVGAALVDTVTYPSLKPKVGASIAFPADCPLERRSDWSAWAWSTASWFPGFEGTPNGPNTDVSCP